MKPSELREVFKNENRDKKLLILSYLDDIFEMYKPHCDIQGLLQELLEICLHESSNEVLIEGLGTLRDGTNSHPDKRIDLTPLAKKLYDIPRSALPVAIAAIAATNDQKYSRYIRNFAQDTDPYIASEAKSALMEFQTPKND